jgi:uncharacterized protein
MHPSGEVAIEIAGELLSLLSERIVWWQRTATLLIADPHWGKAAAFRVGGVPVPRGTTTGGIARLDAALARTHAQRLVFLGDFLHAREGRSEETLRVLGAWRLRTRELDLVIVRGNHDRRAGDPPAELHARCVDAPLLDAPFVFTHHPAESNEGYVLSGHLHPAIRLVGPGAQRERLPCFWIRPTSAVLPAFGDFTGLADVEPTVGDRVFVLADGRVIEMTRLGA